MTRPKVSPMGQEALWVVQLPKEADGTHPFTTHAGTFGHAIKPGRHLPHNALMVVPQCRCMLQPSHEDALKGITQYDHGMVEDRYAIILYEGEYEELNDVRASQRIKHHIASYLSA